MITGIDHLVIAVKDLEAATRAYGELGFTVVPGGRHPVGTYNTLIAFPDGSYLELIGFYRDNPDHRWWAALQRGGGLVDYCLQTDDLMGDTRAFRDAGVDIADPVSQSRVRPDGYQLRWVFSLARGPHRGVGPFLINDETPRSPEATTKAPGPRPSDQPLALTARWSVSILPAMPSDAALLTRDLALDLGRVRSCRRPGGVRCCLPADRQALSHSGPSPTQPPSATAASPTHATSQRVGRTRTPPLAIPTCPDCTSTRDRRQPRSSGPTSPTLSPTRPGGGGRSLLCTTPSSAWYTLVLVGHRPGRGRAVTAGPPAQQVPAHDHGGAAGAFTVVDGTPVEDQLDPGTWTSRPADHLSSRLATRLAA